MNCRLSQNLQNASVSSPALSLYHVPPNPVEPSLYHVPPSLDQPGLVTNQARCINIDWLTVSIHDRPIRYSDRPGWKELDNLTRFLFAIKSSHSMITHQGRTYRASYLPQGPYQLRLVSTEGIEITVLPRYPKLAYLQIALKGSHCPGLSLTDLHLKLEGIASTFVKAVDHMSISRLDLCVDTTAPIQPLALAKVAGPLKRYPNAVYYYQNRSTIKKPSVGGIVTGFGTYGLSRAGQKVRVYDRQAKGSTTTPLTRVEIQLKRERLVKLGLASFSDLTPQSMKQAWDWATGSYFILVDDQHNLTPEWRLIQQAGVSPLYSSPTITEVHQHRYTFIPLIASDDLPSQRDVNQAVQTGFENKGLTLRNLILTHDSSIGRHHTHSIFNHTRFHVCCHKFGLEPTSEILERDLATESRASPIATNTSNSIWGGRVSSEYASFRKTIKEMVACTTMGNKPELGKGVRAWRKRQRAGPMCSSANCNPPVSHVEVRNQKTTNFGGRQTGCVPKRKNESISKAPFSGGSLIRSVPRYQVQTAPL